MEEVVVVVGVGPVTGALCCLLYRAAFEDAEGVCNAAELLRRGTGFLTPDLDVTGAFCCLLCPAAFEDAGGVCNVAELLRAGFLTPDLDVTGAFCCLLCCGTRFLTPGLDAKHFVRSGWSIMLSGPEPVGVRERPYVVLKDPAAQPV